MTDKNIKDYCKNCDVEPPAMRFKCPECEHNPDKEQIIIDGIQFNKFGDFYVDYDLSGKFQSISSSAKEYKILKSLIEQLTRKTKECEQIKEKYEALKLENQEGYEIVAELKQECEKLKSQVDEDYNYYTTELKTLRDIISNKEKRNAALFLTSGRYRKALEEIERELKEDIYCESQECGCDNFEECLKCTKEYILDIISRAKGEE